MSNLSFSDLAFSTNFCLVTLFDRKLRLSKNRQIDYFLAFLINFLSTQNVNVARFARNVECLKLVGTSGMIFHKRGGMNKGLFGARKPV